ncbi:MAG: Gfo/Idh/MocA family protein [Planctomycetota bacterium]
MLKSCLLGCGGRARGHADAYRFVEKSRLEAVCDMNEERLHPFAEKWGVPRRYTDLDEMLETERPDLLHVVTQPQLRVELLTAACEHGVPAVLVEKPLCLDAEDFNAIAALGERTETRICVNHQLRFHPQTLEFIGLVRNGAIGELRLIDASARLGQAGQGTHILNLILAYADARPERILAQVSGGTKWLGGNHPCPDESIAEIHFEGGLRALFSCGANAPVCGDPERDNMHKRIAVYGTEGFVHWMMNAWELHTPERGYASGEKSYGEEDVRGQAAMTDAIFTWLDDDSQPHPNRLEVSLAESNTVLGLYQSALDQCPVALPFTPEGSLLARLRERL